ncbi:hypothetical protein TELCIR_24515, partial [Teladorsagia circumcincta]
VIFGTNLAFLPLMVISVYNAVGVLACYIWLIILVFDDDIGVAYKKKHCELIEGFIKAGHYPVQAVESLEEVEVVGGIDISTSKNNNGFAVVAFSVFEYPSMRPLAIFDDVAVITEPYITDYLAVREAAPVANFVNKVLADYPHLRPDVILCDGNGQFHIRSEVLLHESSREESTFLQDNVGFHLLLGFYSFFMFLLQASLEGIVTHR